MCCETDYRLGRTWVGRFRGMTTELRKASLVRNWKNAYRKLRPQSAKKFPELRLSIQKWGLRNALQRNAPDGRVEQLDEVANRQLSPCASQRRLELQQAAGVGGHNDVRL